MPPGWGPGRFRTATLEPASKQIISAPQPGFILSVSARAGDQVKKGEVLTTLDEKELKLQKMKLKSEYEQHVMERRAGLIDRKESFCQKISVG